MLRARTAVRPSPTRRSLRVEALEDRAVPASAMFDAGTLIVTAAENETVTITPVAGQPAGYVSVSDGGAAPVFTSGTAGQVVQNLIVKFDAALGTLSVESGVRVPGSVRIVGAQARTTVSLAGDVSVGRDLVFRAAAGAADDTVIVGRNLVVGRHTAFNLGDGTNAVTLGGGALSGRLDVTGGAGADTVTVSNAGLAAGANDPAAMRVGGLVTLYLGHGANAFRGDGTLPFVTGRGLIVQGGRDADTIDFHDAVADPKLVVGRNLTVRLGQAAGGTNRADLEHVTVGGTFTYRGTTGDDAVSLGTTAVGKNLRVFLGRAGGLGQRLVVGTGEAAMTPQGEFARPPVTVGGNAVVRGGAGLDTIALDFLTVQGRLRLATLGGDDRVSVGQTTVIGGSVLRLGAGNDALTLDPVLTNPGRNFLTGLGLDLDFVCTLLTDIVALDLVPDVLGDFVTDLLDLDIDGTGLPILAELIGRLDLDALGLDDLLGRLNCLGVTTLVTQLTGLEIDDVTLATLLNDVLALDVDKLLADVTALLAGGPSAGLIPTVVTTLLGGDVRNLLDGAGSLGMTVDQVAGLLNRLAGLDLARPGLGQLLSGFDTLPVDGAGLARILSGIGQFDLTRIDVVGINLGDVLGLLLANRPAASRYNAFTLFAGAGDDRVTLGEAAKSIDFAARVRLNGGLGRDVLVASATNTYRGTDNREDFEVGTM